jgi:hypothetical protein
MCLSLHYAFEDKGYLGALEEPDRFLYRHNEAKARMMESSKANANQDRPLKDDDSILPDRMVRHWRREVLEFIEGRVLCNNERRREMGFKERNVDKVIWELKESYPFVFIDDDDDDDEDDDDY